MNKSEKKQKNIEVEIRALISDIKKLKDKIKSIGATYKGKSYLHDIYFCRKEYNSIKEVEMDKLDSYSLRLRKAKNDDGAEVITLNSKTITQEKDHNAWEEHEVKVTNFKEAARILTRTEFKPFFELEKIRYHYILGELNVFAEDIKNFGYCVEVEIMSKQCEEKKSKQKILDFLERIEIPKKNNVPKSVTNLVMKKRAFKSKIKI